MPLEILTIPCLSDNYAFLIRNDALKLTALVDAPEAAPIRDALQDRGWGLDMIFLTHHHNDHIDGVEELRAEYGPAIVGAAADTHRLPPLDVEVEDGTVFTFAGEDVEIFDVSGHTNGHIAFYLPDSQAVFTADSLMALGCGRLFEGTPERMWESLSKLAALPPETIVHSGHEYTASNAKFALTIDPHNPALQKRVQEITKARAADIPTVPSKLSDELATNPFLRANDPQVKAGLDMQDAPDAVVFKEIRRRKDIF
ncbi:UNVERIFIED_CONTAM: hypothetical protein GTU68_022186 [Idotea baltica]|nr:hypothetical protein [Idotea baltica]